MGAVDFYTEAKGATPEEAYREAVDKAYAEFGHQDGYNGTITTTNGFIRVKCSPINRRTVTRRKAVYDIWEGRNIAKWKRKGFKVEVIQDSRIKKWGKCGCFALGKNLWGFYGIAAE